MTNILQLHQHIARANFTADRGVRYGQDHYDDRMQATRVLEVKSESVELHVVTDLEMQSEAQGSESKDSSNADSESTSTTQTPNSSRSKDPLRMFGILVPQSLRLAQSQAVKLVEEIVPKLVNINMEMERLEIDIRRKRKHRTKAESKTSTLSHVKNTAVETTV